MFLQYRRALNSDRQALTQEHRRAWLIICIIIINIIIMSCVVIVLKLN